MAWLNAAEIKRIILCSGKIYYELEQKREELKRDDVAIIRMEQLYPLAKDLLLSVLGDYRPNTAVCWVQEEPENMGAWRFLRGNFGEKLFERYPLMGVYRQSAASPATGSASSHRLEQEKLLAAAFGEV